MATWRTMNKRRQRPNGRQIRRPHRQLSDAQMKRILRQIDTTKLVNNLLTKAFEELNKVLDRLRGMRPPGEMLAESNKRGTDGISDNR
jgi:hypothetical protein